MPDALKLANSHVTHFPGFASDAIELAGKSRAILRTQELVRRAATLRTGVLIVAEEGCDAESVARELHARSRSAAPWLRIDCAEDGNRIEPLLFGQPAGEPSSDVESVSADSRIAAARGGTLFLRDVGELPFALQARLARIARDGELRVDGDLVEADVRLVASSSPSLDSDVREHRFRADLYRRLGASRIDLPPLRDRPDDVQALAERLLKDCSAASARPRAFTQAALALLSALSWPGNLAELRAVVERAAGEAADATIPVEQVLPALRLDRVRPAVAPSGKLRDARLRFEREYISAVLQQHGWRMADAAQTLGIQRPNLYRKAKQLGIPLAPAADTDAMTRETT